MPDYRVLGGALRSDLEFPGIRATESVAPTWRLEVIDHPAPALPAEHLGEARVRGEFSARASRTSEGYRLAYDDTGTYDIGEQGSLIRWYRPPPAGRPWKEVQFYEAVRIDVLGRVLALALHLQGIRCLHASAVRIGDQAVGLLAPKSYGKSTLAYAMVKAGAHLITDDTLPVELGSPVLARPGVHHVRFWEDSAHHLVTPADDFAKGEFGKFQSGNLPDDQLVFDSTRLAALYVLLPVQDQPDLPPARRDPLHPVAAALALVEHARLGALLGGEEAAALLEWAGDLSRMVPVQVLRVVRDWGRLPELARTVIGFHQ